MRTFSIATLGCKVNQYESEQIATLLRGLGLTQADAGDAPDLRIVNSCSVTVQAASKSRQTVRREVRLSVLGAEGDAVVGGAGHGRVVATGCWATSNKKEAAAIAGVDAVLTHHEDVNAELTRLVEAWKVQDQNSHDAAIGFEDAARRDGVRKAGTTSLPLLDQRHTGHQRAFLKIQDGCDAHCTYCIIPSLRPGLWSKSVGDAVEEARRLVAAGHAEIILTGIFLGAFGQETALRRRQSGGDKSRLVTLIEALCTQVPGLRRLRLSSLEPGDLTPDLVAVLATHAQVAPHFHLPLQSGSDYLLRRMNRQYTHGDFLRMMDRVRAAFDRPAITTDIIVGFPGENDEQFDQTLDVVRQAGFIHIHAFSFSPRPGTAAARWTKDFVQGPIVNERIEMLNAMAREDSYVYRRGFLGQTVELLVEQPAAAARFETLQQGRCERYFPVYFECDRPRTGESVAVRVERVTRDRTFGALVGEVGGP